MGYETSRNGASGSVLLTDTGADSRYTPRMDTDQQVAREAAIEGMLRMAYWALVALCDGDRQRALARYHAAIPRPWTQPVGQVPIEEQAKPTERYHRDR